VSADENMKCGFKTVAVQLDDGTLLRIFGDLDVYSASKLHAVLEEVLKRNPARLVLDMSGMNFLGTDGIAEMVYCYKEMDERKGMLKIFGLQRNILNSLKLTNIDVIFEIFETEKEALA